MTSLTTDQALENIYTSILNNNQDLDTHIAALKATFAPGVAKEVLVDPARLAQGNRQGRKLMQSYFRKRGITVNFKA